jgi:hypothetical protein
MGHFHGIAVLLRLLVLIGCHYYGHLPYLHRNGHPASANGRAEGFLGVAADHLDVIGQCEYLALKYGTDIADAFNKPISEELSWHDRVHQDFITEHLGFAPWLDGGDTKQLQAKGGWKGKGIEESPYAILNKKWVYMFGDSTTRQIWSSFAAPFQENNFERNSKEWSRHYVSTLKASAQGLQ